MKDFFARGFIFENYGATGGTGQAENSG